MFTTQYTNYFLFTLQHVATQMWCLGRLLPMIIGSSIQEDNAHWNNFLLMLKIINFVFSPLLSRSIATYLVYLIDDYLKTFVELYPTCSIIPKQRTLHGTYTTVDCKVQSGSMHYKNLIYMYILYVGVAQ